ncbi:hypothetical protein OKA04_08685 [Luteolibacter flavescens]|uniref:Alginate biosynthesis protein AlgF n=1 Tax=Luteolibacter flavescens TaxID=1859460 RepID=A0ABT3FMJ7_9BACT|nr:hypothetical protein [Luteolibacter flavescens]MCW1884801.1 hypothetical protein [Luteolibacter flavescens]
MNPTRILSLAAACLIPLSASAQEDSASKLTVRAFLNDPANPATELFAPDSPDHLIPLVLAPGELPAGQAVALIDGKLNIYRTGTADAANLLASATVPPNLKQAIAIIQPRGDTKKPPCSIVFLDDSIAAFPPGESRAISFTALPIALQAGEHKIAVAPGKITTVPPVAKVDPYNMAQTNFLYKAGESWVPFSETKMKYLKEYRQVFICAVRPGTKVPTLVTLLDDTPKPVTP